MTPTKKIRLTRDLQALAALFATSGTLHLFRPRLFETIIPPLLPAPRLVVYLSGVGELVCAAGLLHPASRKAAGWASAALLVVVFPGNVQMAVTEGRRADRGIGSRGKAVATLIRLPLQIPLIRTALKATGRV
jgi:uncharacterized membrane protein